MDLFIIYFKSCFFGGYFLFRGSIPIFLEDCDWMETPEERVRHWTSLMSLQPQERYFIHLCESLLFVKAWMIWIYSWLSFKLISLWGTYVYRRKMILWNSMTEREAVKQYQFTYDEYLIYAQCLDQNWLWFSAQTGNWFASVLHM